MDKKKADERAVALREEYARRAEERKELERNWLVNLNYYNGNQYAEMLPSGALVSTGKKYPWQLTSVYNHIAPIVDARLAKFIQMKTDVTCLPASSATDDVQAALFSSKLIKTAEEENNFSELNAEALFWAEVCGTVFFKVVWSKDKGRLLTTDGLREGDVEIDVCPPYEIYPDSVTARDLGECRSVIHARMYPEETVRERWGVEPKSEKDAGVLSVGRSAFAETAGFVSEDKEGYVLVLERYDLPTREYPNGRLLVAAGEEIVYDGDLPYVTEEGFKRGFPFVRQVAVPNPGCFFGTSLIERMIPVQRAYNEVKNRKHEFFNRMTAGVLVAEDGSVDVDALEEEGIAPGKVILYRQGCNQPQMLTFGTVPKEFGEEEERLLKEFASVSGVSDFLLTGGSDGHEYSGTALNIIIEQNNNRLSITTESVKNAAKERAGKILRLYKQFATVERLARTDDSSFNEWEAFVRSDVTANDIVFDLDEGQINTLSDRRGLAKEIYEMKLLEEKDGLLTSESRRKLLSLLGCEGFANSRSADELQRKRAVEEQEECGKKPLIVAETDDHAIHMDEHVKYVLSKGDALTEGEKTAIQKHIADHRAMLAKAE